jgi:DNA-directed RNA polymerase delta subunit
MLKISPFLLTVSQFLLRTSQCMLGGANWGLNSLRSLNLTNVYLNNKKNKKKKKKKKKKKNNNNKVKSKPLELVLLLTGE